MPFTLPSSFLYKRANIQTAFASKALLKNMLASSLVVITALKIGQVMVIRCIIEAYYKCDKLSLN